MVECLLIAVAALVVAVVVLVAEVIHWRRRAEALEAGHRLALQGLRTATERQRDMVECLIGLADKANHYRRNRRCDDHSPNS